MEKTLPEELQARLEGIHDAEIVAGIPSYNNVRTVGHVARAVAAGLQKYFPERKSVIINSDGGSGDGTREAVLNAEIEPDVLVQVSQPQHPISRISTPYQGTPGKGSAFRAIFSAAHTLGAKACIVVDSDLRSITPQWVELLAGPVLARDFDYVAPYYQRHKFDGTITNSIIYPLSRALFGKRLRQPIGGDFGISGRLAKRFLEKEGDWHTDVARFGIDIWMTVTAVAEHFRVAQSYLGAKLHDAKDPGADLTSMFRQVVGSLFALMEDYESVWQSVRASEPVAMFGFPFDVGVEPVHVNVERMIHAFRQGAGDLREIYDVFLEQSTVAALAECARQTDEAFRIPDPLWVEIVEQFAIAFHQRSLDREHLLQSLVPLYLGRTASFVLEMRESDAGEVEQRIEQLCTAFESDKHVLREHWNKRRE